MSSSETGAVNVPSKNGSLIDIDNMKVPELKKRLKSMGLPTTGNKAELVERLQEAYLNEKDGSLDGTLDDESLEEALLNDDHDQSALPETMLGNEEFTFSSPEKEIRKVAESNASKPLKKRVIAQSPPPTTESPKASKIVIKRDNYSVVEEPTKSPVKKDHPLIEAPKSEEAVKASKVLSEAERKQLRAKRFNIESKPTSDSSVTKLAPKVTAATENTKITSAAAVKGSSLDLLRKRAERFGENVSAVMKKLENQEKLLKRKLKFTGDSVTSIISSDKSSSTEQDQKKKRMERFGLN